MNVILQATARLARIFDAMGRAGTAVLPSSLWGLEFADAGADPAAVVEKLAYDNYTSAEIVAAELLTAPIFNAADCEAVNV